MLLAMNIVLTLSFFLKLISSILITRDALEQVLISFPVTSNKNILRIKQTCMKILQTYKLANRSNLQFECNLTLNAIFQQHSN